MLVIIVGMRAKETHDSKALYRITVWGLHSCANSYSPNCLTCSFLNIKTSISSRTVAPSYRRALQYSAEIRKEALTASKEMKTKQGNAVQKLGKGLTIDTRQAA